METPPVLLHGQPTGTRCPVCNVFVDSSTRYHDRELHLIAALERLAAALEAKDAD